MSWCAATGAKHRLEGTEPAKSLVDLTGPDNVDVCNICRLVEQRGSQRALNVFMCQLRSPFTCNNYFVCTGKKAVYFLWLHRNKVYNMVAL